MLRFRSWPESLARLVSAISLLFSLVYIIWRWGWTLNTDALWFSIPLAVAETYGLVTALFMTFTAWRLKEREPKRAPPGRTVDVFVTTYDEPLTVIRKTALAAREIRYPHATYILDDGKRDEILALAEELDIGYIRRDGNEHAKAGNLNNALQNTDGEFILQLDADHVPLPHILDRLVGFMDDERVAFVQSPQDFYNTDAFTYDVNQRARRIWEDQQLFFRVLQPGKDRVGAAFFVGSCALLRRAALDEIGGFATGTITEDIETSLLLHARGWQSVYYGETLAYGLAPASAAAFHVQHLRWGQGAMQALRRYRPLTMKGLTVAQRIAYFDSLTTYLGGFQRLILYLAPIAFFVTGEFPLRADARQFALFFVPYITLQFLSFKFLARGHGSLLLADRYGMAKFFTHLLSITGYSRRRRLKFKVTPKGLSDVPFRTYAPQLALIVVTVFAISWSVATQLRGAEDYDVPGWGALAFWVNLVFALWNAAVAGYIVRMSLRMKQKRADHRFAESLPVTIRVLRRDGKLSSREMGITENLNPYGAALRCTHPIEEDTRVEVTLPLSTREVAARGKVVHRRVAETTYGSVYVHGVEFDELDWESRDAIELHCAHHATPLERQRYDEGASTIGARIRRLTNVRGETRVPVGMPARVVALAGGAERDLGFALLEDASATGARVLLDHPIAPDSVVRLEIPNTEIEVSGRVAFVHALETSVGMRFIVGLDTRPADVPAEVESRAFAAWFEERMRVFAQLRATAWRYAGNARSLALQSTERVRAGMAERARRRRVAAESAPPEPAPVHEPVYEPVHEPVYEPVHEPVHEPVARIVQEERVVAAAPTKYPWQIDLDAEAEQEQNVVPPAAEPPSEEQPYEEGAEEMERQFFASQDPGARPAVQSAGATLLAIAGSGARLEGKFDISDSIEIECDVSGELVVGGRLVIGPNGVVDADVRTVDAVIQGRFTGNLIATGSIEIASSGRASGNLETRELVVAKGGVFTGNVTRPAEQQAPRLHAVPQRSEQPEQVAHLQPVRDISIVPQAQREEADAAEADPVTDREPLVSNVLPLVAEPLNKTRNGKEAQTEPQAVPIAPRSWS